MVAGGERLVREFEMDMYTLLYLKWINDKNRCIAHGTLFSVMWQPRWEESLGENGYMYMMAESLCCTPETNTTLFVNWLYSNKSKPSLNR